jgi:hypothetical protein
MICRMAVMLFCLSELAMACSCRAPIGHEYPFWTAFSVFDGVVTGKRYFENEKQREAPSRTLVTFKVLQSWKGPSESSVRLHVWERAMMCDSYTFEIGRRYVVYAIQQDKENGWADQYPKGTKILALGMCILRVREDFAAEASLLGKSRPSSN